MFRLRKNQVLHLHKQKVETVPSESYEKMLVLFLIFFFSSGVFLTFLLEQINYLVSRKNVKGFS